MTPTDSLANRRGFLRNSFALATVTTAALASTPGAASSRETRRKLARVAVVSSPADELVAALAGHPGCQVVASARSSLAVQSRLSHAATKKKMDPPANLSAIAHLISGPTVDSVVLPSRGKGISTALELALFQGKSVILTAPCGLNSYDAAHLGSISEGKPAHLFFPHRAAHGIRQAIDYLQSGKFGQLTATRLLFREPVHTRKNRGQSEVRSLVRLLDLAIWGNGDNLPTQIQAFGTRGKRAARLTGALITFADSGELSLEVSRPFEPAVHGVRSGVVFDTTAGRLVCRDDDSAVAIRADGEISRVFKGSSDPLAPFARGSAPIAPLSKCWRSSAVWHLLVESLRSGSRMPSLELTGITPTVTEPISPSPVVGKVIAVASYLRLPASR